MSVKGGNHKNDTYMFKNHLLFSFKPYAFNQNIFM